MLKTGSGIYCRHNVVRNCSFLWERAGEVQKKELKLRFPELDIKLASELDPKTRAVAMRQRVHLAHGSMDCRWWKGHPSRQALCPYGLFWGMGFGTLPPLKFFFVKFNSLNIRI
jgi:hypothetical protein